MLYIAYDLRYAVSSQLGFYLSAYVDYENWTRSYKKNADMRLIEYA